MTLAASRIGRVGDGLHRGAGVALWRQIADSIRRGIQDGLADSSGRLPAESLLAQRFGVNRHTVRAAIAALTHEGVLRSEQGRGTYVRAVKKLNYPISQRTRFTSGLSGQVRNKATELLSHHEEQADYAVAAALGIELGNPVTRMETLGTADGIPILVATSWFDATRFPFAAEAFAKSGSVTQMLREFGVEDYSRDRTQIEGRHADQVDTRYLQLSAGAIVLVATAINVDPAGKPVQYSVTRFAADRVELMVKSN